MRVVEKTHLIKSLQTQEAFIAVRISLKPDRTDSALRVNLGEEDHGREVHCVCYADNIVNFVEASGRGSE